MAYHELFVENLDSKEKEGYSYREIMVKVKRVKHEKNEALLKKTHYGLTRTSDIVTFKKVCGKNTHALMTKLKSRLGNQMFQYAATLGMAARHNLVPVVLTNSSNIFQVFKINQVFSLPPSCQDFSTYKYKQTNAQKNHANIYDEGTEKIGSISRKKNSNVLLDGNWANPKYFENIQNTLKKIFVLKDEIKNRPKRFLDKNIPEKLKGRKFVKVGVHLRLGDRDEIWEDTRQEYINKAVKFYQNRYDNVLFVVCSDNITKSREIFPRGTDVLYSEFSNVGLKNEPWYDFALLTLCDHSLISVGTFSWWAGFLTGGDVVYHTAYPRFKGNAKERLQLYQDFYPSQWHHIKV